MESNVFHYDVLYHLIHPISIIITIIPFPQSLTSKVILVFYLFFSHTLHADCSFLSLHSSQFPPHLPSPTDSFPNFP